MHRIRQHPERIAGPAEEGLGPGQEGVVGGKRRQRNPRAGG